MSIQQKQNDVKRVVAMAAIAASIAILLRFAVPQIVSIFTTPVTDGIYGGYDALHYHIPFGDHYIDTGNLGPWRGFELNYLSSYFYGYEIAACLVHRAFPWEWGYYLVPLAFWLALWGGCYKLARVSNATPPIALLLSTMVAVSPMVIGETHNQSTDLPLATFVVWSLRAILAGRTNSALVMLGFVCASRLPGVLYALPLLALWPFLGTFKRDKDTVGFACIGLSVAAFWFVRNLLCFHQISTMHGQSLWQTALLYHPDHMWDIVSRGSGILVGIPQAILTLAAFVALSWRRQWPAVALLGLLFWLYLVNPFSAYVPIQNRAIIWNAYNIRYAMPLVVCAIPMLFYRRKLSER